MKFEDKHILGIQLSFLLLTGVESIIRLLL